MLRADLGDFLYIIIGIIILFGSGIRKLFEARRQQQNPVPTSEIDRPYDDFEEEAPAPPQTLEDLVKRMMQANTPPIDPDFERYEEEAQSQETIPEEPVKRENYYQPIKSNFAMSADEKAVYAIKPADEEKTEILLGGERDFDLREAVIAAEILHRKY